MKMKDGENEKKFSALKESISNKSGKEN
jgi:hypothetical protein